MTSPALGPPPNTTPLTQDDGLPGPTWARWFEQLRAKQKECCDEATGGGGGGALSSASPADLGTTSAGVDTEASRSDHVHAHGNLAGGSLHAAAVAGGASGFLTGTDKTKLDALPASYLALGATSPADVGTTAVGVAVTAAHADHVHAHGNQLGGTLHAVVGASAGFMSAADKTKLDGIATSAAAVTASAPADVGTTAVGVATTAARADHVHGHGNLAGGSFHALAIAAGAAGFLSGTDKSKLDGVAASAAALTASAPADVGTTAVGVATVAARGDHVHAHGNQLGGSLHAVAVAGVSAGFVSASDQTKLNNTTGVNTGDGQTLGQILAFTRCLALP